MTRKPLAVDSNRRIRSAQLADYEHVFPQALERIVDWRDGGIVSAPADNDVDLAIYIVAAGGSAPTSTTVIDFILSPGQTLETKAFTRLNDVYVNAAAPTVGISYKATELIGADVEGLLTAVENQDGAYPDLSTIYLLFAGGGSQTFSGIGFDAAGKPTPVTLSVPGNTMPVGSGMGSNQLGLMLSGSYSGIVAVVFQNIPVATTKFAMALSGFIAGMGKVYPQFGTLDAGPINGDFAPSMIAQLNSAGQLPCAIEDASGVQADVFGGSSVDTSFAGLVTAPTQKTVNLTHTTTGSDSNISLATFMDGVWWAIAISIIAATGSVVFVVQIGNDNATWTDVGLWSVSGSGLQLFPDGQPAVAGANLLASLLGAKYVRLYIPSMAASTTFNIQVHLTTAPVVLPAPTNSPLANTTNAGKQTEFWPGTKTNYQSKGSAGNFYGAVIQNISAKPLYFSLFDGTPGSGGVLKWSVVLAANSATTIDDTAFGTYCATNINWVIGDTVGATAAHSTTTDVNVSVSFA